MWPRMTKGEGDGAALGSQERLQLPQQQERNRGDATKEQRWRILEPEQGGSN